MHYMLVRQITQGYYLRDNRELIDRALYQFEDINAFPAA
jgi:hypothetical protein